MTFQFSDAQQEKLDDAARQDEAHELLPIMRRNFAEKTARFDDVSLEQEIKNALDRAADLEIQTRTSSVDFVILWLLVGADFDQIPQISKFLKRHFGSIDQRVSFLLLEFKAQLLQKRFP